MYAANCPGPTSSRRTDAPVDKPREAITLPVRSGVTDIRLDMIYQAQAVR